MVQISTILTALATTTALLSATVGAHPGEHEGHSASMLARRAHFQAHSRRSLAACKDSLKSRDLESRAIARRAALAEDIRRERNIRKRSPEYVTSKNHETNITGVTLDTETGVLFSGDVKCVLQPEVTEGPYYVDGELIRHDLREGQKGVDLWADIQMIDINTCEPIPNLYLDWWHTNATGVYSGVVANGNGDSSDLSNINNTHGRGIRPTDADGVAQFLTTFPGHYAGRTTHVHVLAHINATVHRNQTVSGGHAAHVGQVYFDQSLISTVESVEPYASNNQSITLNVDDMILAQETEGMDPVMEYAFLGDDVSDGIMAWITIGVDAMAQHSVSSAVTWTAHGGVANAAVGGGAGFPSGAAPSGAAPSGASPSGL